MFDRTLPVARSIRLRIVYVLGMALVCVLFPSANARADDKPKPFVEPPSTVSPEAAAYLKSLPGPSARPIAPAPDDLAGWKRLQEKREAEAEPRVAAFVKRYQPTITERKIGGVPVLDIKPRGWKDNGKALVYAHGGAYTTFSARSTLPSALVAAAATGLRVISIDYALAPAAKWPRITDEVLVVFRGLEAEGLPAKMLAFYGDSAGGGLVAGATLKMRDKGLTMPAALVLWSPWSDIGEHGDTFATLKHAEPTYTYEKHLKNAAAAYADPNEHKHPYVSPVYGDYAKGFPPTLIQGGTREIFLSNFVRHYRALDTAGQHAVLDLYEGMPHVFQSRLADAPEGKAALAKMKGFLERHLGR